MVSSVNSAIASALFSASSGDSVGVSADMLTAWAKAKTGVGANTTTTAQDPNAPIAPVWTPGISPSAAALVQRALTNKPFYDIDAKLYSDLGATGDYKRLFALYNGLTTLQALAGSAEDASLSKAQLAQTTAQFTRGLTELQAFFTKHEFEDIRLAQGDRVDATQSTLALPAKQEDYVTPIIHRGGLYDKVSGLAADAKFDIVATSAGGTVRNVSIDLSEMGSITRTLGNVVSFVNGKLSAAGASSRIETIDQTPKTTAVLVGGRTIETRYTGPRQYALKVDIRSSEKVAFQPVAADAAFYVVGTTAGGARLIKLADVGGVAGQPVLLDRPGATTDPTGANVATGWLGPGAPYTSITNAGEQRTNPLMTTGTGTFETLMRDNGEAVLQLEFTDGRKLSVSTGWRSDDLEAWRTRSGETSDRAIMDDLAERLTQLLHEQGVAAGVDVYEDSGSLGFSIHGAEGLRASGLAISGRAATLTTVQQPGMVGGLRDGVFARRFEAAGVGAASDLFIGDQSFVITTTSGSHTITIGGGEDGVDGATIAARLNDKLREKGISAAAYLVDNGGALTLRFDALHNVTAISATLNDEAYDTALQAPGAWANGGLPASSAGQPYGDATRTYIAAGSPLSTHTGALDIEISVATPIGNKAVSVSISAQERLDHPDGSGELAQLFQDRIATALNTAGVYVGASSGDLTQWQVADASGQRIASIIVNGDAQTLTGTQPSFALGGAQSAERSFTSGQAATGVSDDVAALLSDDSVSITFSTVWGQRSVSATLQPGDARTLESTALRLNEALASQGYDLGVAATALSGGGAGLRIVTGASHTVRSVSNIALGASNTSATLDAIDSTNAADDPPGTLGVAQRASRGAAASETIPAATTLVAPSANAAAWFPGRAFDISVGGGAKVATARSVATGADGAVYVLADLSGDSANSAIKGARDIALLKYDSAGKLAFTQMLGASQSASGFALAVSADGKVAVAGSVEGDLSGTTGKGGADSFVTVFDANGKETWTARRGATLDDQALAIAFAPNGSLVVSGKTKSALGGQVALGQSDGYVRGYTAGGAELFTRQFGTGGDDAATALLVRDDGAGGMEIFTGGVEDNRGIVRRFTYSGSAGLAAGATRDIGYFYGGAINAIAADGGSLYVGGEIGADRLTLGTPARAGAAGKDGFVARLDSGLVSTSLDRASYLGSAQDDAVKGLAVVNGQVYAAGVSGGVIAGAGAGKSPSSFLSRLDASGDLDWTRTFNSAGGAIAMTSLAVDQSGASPLDVLGLPRGVVPSNQSAPLVDRSALRVGDEFRIGAEGRRLIAIRITGTDTLSSLVTAINRAIGTAGRAEIIKEGDVERLKISPRNGQALRIDAGATGRDALSALGLAQGIVSVNATGRGLIKTFGLGLIAADLKLDSKEAITRTKAEISAAVSIVRQAYDTLLNPNAKEPTDAEKALAARREAAGAAPEYYSAQLANYKAALARLTGS